MNQATIHAVNEDGQHDEMDTREDCPACQKAAERPPVLALSGWIGNRADAPATIQITDQLARAFVANPRYDAEGALHGQILNWLCDTDGQNLAWDPAVEANGEAIADLYWKVRTLEKAATPPDWTPEKAAERLSLLDDLSDAGAAMERAGFTPATEAEYRRINAVLRPFQIAWGYVPGHNAVSGEHRCEGICYDAGVARCGAAHPTSGLPCFRTAGDGHTWHEAYDGSYDGQIWNAEDGRAVDGSAL